MRIYHTTHRIRALQWRRPCAPATSPPPSERPSSRASRRARRWRATRSCRSRSCGRACSCTGYSVIRGTDISSFDVEIVDVLSGDASANDGPRILVRVSGPAVDRTGVGPGFSGSPIYCDGKNAGAISEAIGEYGGKTVLATPIEEILANPPDAPRGKPVARMSRVGRVLPLAEPLTVSGLSPALAARLTQAGARSPARRQVLAAPAMPLAPFPPQPPRPGSSLSVGYSSGDIAVGAVGTVAYVDGDRVWGFGHPFENSGLRSLLLQDAYVYTVIFNPNSGDDTSASTYKLAAVGHDLGTISNDASDAVSAARACCHRPSQCASSARTTTPARAARSPPAWSTRPTPVRRPAAPRCRSSAPLALAQGASEILRSAPGKLSGTVCIQITLRERKQPLRVCNRYVSALAPSDPHRGRQHRRRRRRLRRARRADRARRLQAARAARHRVRRARAAPARAPPGVPALASTCRGACAPAAACARACTCRSSAARRSRARSGCGSRAG